MLSYIPKYWSDFCSFSKVHKARLDQTFDMLTVTEHFIASNSQIYAPCFGLGIIPVSSIRNMNRLVNGNLIFCAVLLNPSNAVFFVPFAAFTSKSCVLTTVSNISESRGNWRAVTELC